MYKRQITGRGTVATGRVERGTVKLKDEVEIIGLTTERRKMCIRDSIKDVTADFVGPIAAALTSIFGTMGVDAKRNREVKKLSLIHI